MGKNLVVVVHDSILNSVFHGQVLAPVLNKLNSGLYSHAYIVSFERDLLSSKHQLHLHKKYPKLSFIIIKRWGFTHYWFLFFQIRALKKFLRTLSTYDLIARGALSGFLVLQINHKNCNQLIIQARGLLTEEYRYEHKQSSWFLSPIHKVRAHWYKKIEQQVYTKKIVDFPYVIEVVSTALQEYLIRVFGADSQHIIYAHEDTPVSICSERVKQWRFEVRQQLALSENTLVYCFSGAVKSWQRPIPIVRYFADCYQKNSACFLLVLTPNIECFLEVLKQYVPAHTYHVVSVPYDTIYTYLAASDIGLIFREPDIISWVARPIKAMEYEAVGLKIVHNNTVNWLIQRYGINRELAP